MGKFLDEIGITALCKKIKASTTQKTIQLTYSQLKTLRDGKKLVPGQSYRITDFVTTSVQDDTRSAGHPFDIIVVADDEGTLSENAHACLHTGDTYFAECKLDVWELKYCLDNDTNRFAWADATNGKGVVWWMKDEWDNECFYDFKNIQYKRYKVTSTQSNTVALVNSCPYLGNIAIGNSVGLSESDTTDFKWVYTFTKYTKTGDLIEDASISVRYSYAGEEYGCYCNKIGAFYIATSNDNIPFVSLFLNHGMFWTNGYGDNKNVICFLNTIGSGCACFTGLKGVTNITCGDNCYCWTCGNACNYWSCGDNCTFWTCGNDSGSWSCGDNCLYWSCGNDCGAWTCGFGCIYWSCGDNCSYWTCGNACSWTCGEETADAKILQDYVSSFHLEDGVRNITIKSNGTPTQQQPLQNFVVKSGVMGTDSAKLAIVIDTANFPLGSDYQWTIAKNSKGEIKQYCEADLIN